jgi:phage-related minor tail protein
LIPFLPSVPGYTDSFETMLTTMREAFQPMVEVFADIMTPIYDFITAIGELMIKFNEAHPFLAKLIQGFFLLLPILFLIL